MKFKDCVMFIARYGTVDRLLGNYVLNSHKLRHLLTNKFILLRTFDSDLFLQNLIGYLATSTSRKFLHVAVSIFVRSRIPQTIPKFTP